jgi:ABC-type glycerol-3-phosphate transport system substrate-binding protein
MENRKKAAAAAAAVIDYITSEEAAQQVQAMAAGAMVPAPAAGPVKLWGVSGRQDQMQMRNMMQMRTFR